MSAASESKKALLGWIDANYAAFDKMALEIWENPEIAYQEREAAQMQMDFMKGRGFSVTQREGMPMAFLAEWNNGGPVIGILGEYDALPGLSQTVSPRQEPVEEGAPGHGCGHNLLGVGGMLAACAVKEVFSAQNIPVTVRYYGCPAEEQLAGKSQMAKLGYFEGTDVALAWHPADFSSTMDSTMTALASAKFRFKGKASHAGSAPEAGRSALDAVELMNIGANYIREHMLDQDRLHYVITNGGLAPNIVPADAEVWYYLRAPHDGELASLWKRLVKAAKGAAMTTETEVHYEILGGCYNTLQSGTLNKVLESNLGSFAGDAGFDAEDMAFAREVQSTLPPDQIKATLRRMPALEGDQAVLASRPLPGFDQGRIMMASTDVGDVANIMPTSMFWGVTWPVGVPTHSWQATACAGSSIGLKGTRLAAKAIAGCIYDLAADPSIIEAAKREFTERREGKPYRPIEELLEE